MLQFYFVLNIRIIYKGWAAILSYHRCTNCTDSDYSKFATNFLILLKSKGARDYAKKDYAKMDAKLTWVRLLVTQSVQHDAWQYYR